MAADGYLVFNAKIDTDGFVEGTQEITNETKQAASGVANEVKKAAQSAEAAADAANDHIQAILNNTEASSKSKAGKISWIYQKEGMNQSDAMKKAWDLVGRNASDSDAKRVSSSKKANKKIKSDFKNTAKGIESTVSGMVGNAKTAFSKLAGTLTAMLSTAALVAFGKKSLETAATVNAANSQLEQTFGDFRDSAVAAMQRVADESGILETRLQATGTSIYAFARTAGMEGTQALGMMEDALQVAADSAAYYDRSLEETAETLKSYLKGNYANDAALGLSSTEYTRNAKAMALYGKKFNDLSEAQKQLTLLQMVKDANKLSGAMGQAARESEGWENVLGNLKEAWRQLLSVIGQPILKLAVPIVQNLTGALERLTSVANTAWSALSKVMGWETQTQAITAAADAQNQLTEAVEETAKAQDGALAGFDEIQTLSEDTAATAGGGTTAPTAGGGGTAGEVVTVNPQSTANVDNLTAAFERMKTALGPSITSLQNLGIALEPLKTFAAQGLSDFYTMFLEPLGAWVIGEGFPRFVDAITNGLSIVNWETINTSLAGLWTSLEPFAQNVGEGLLWLWENILVPFGTWVMNDVVPVFLDLLSAALTLINSVIEKVKPLLEWLWNNILQPIAKWTGGIIVSVLQKIAENIQKLASVISGDTSITDYIDSLGVLEIIVISIIAAVALVVAGIKIFSTVTAIASTVSTAFGAAIAFITSPVGIVIAIIAALIAIVIVCIKYWDEIKAAAVAAWNYIVDSIKGSWETFKQNVIYPIGKAFQDLWNGIVNAAIGAWDTIKNTFKGIADWLNEKVITPIGNFFAKLWKGIKNGFIDFINLVISGINTMVTAFLAPVNALIDGFNATIGSIPGVGDIPNIKLAIPHIPKLATGAVIPPNREFLAVLGDQKSGTNIETPLETMVQAFEMAFAKSGGSARNTPVILELDGREFGRAVVNFGEKETKRVGLRLVKA